MKTRFSHSRLNFVVLISFLFCGPAVSGQEASMDPHYTTLERASPGGSGKVFEGREISLVMGHQGADWLEREERDEEEKPELLVENLKLTEGMSVADIGAGTGYFSRRLAKAVGETGIVYAVDIQQEMLDLLEESMETYGVENVEPVLGSISDPKLPEGTVDLALMVDVYHEFSHPYEMMQGIKHSLKPGGRVVWVEYRAEDPTVPIRTLHKMTEAQVKKEALVHGLEYVETLDVLPRQHIIIFRKAE